jgi:predicted DNA-binding transcriptional regulator YafY
VRADRLVSLVLLLQARGLMTAGALAAELEVSVRTIYRDLDALSAAGVPVLAESGPGGGCRLLDDYRFPLRGLRPEEAEALLILGVPEALGELGLDGALAMAQHRIRLTAGRDAAPTALVHLDLPRWFTSQEQLPQLKTLAQAVREGRQLSFGYRDKARVVGPLGLVNKAGSWYLVAQTGTNDVPAVFRAARIDSPRLLSDPVRRPPDFELASFWARWSAEFAASRPALAVTVRASPTALAVFPEVFGDGAQTAISSASEPDRDGWRVLTLTFEHDRAAAHRLAGFGDIVEVLGPPEVRDRLIVTAHAIIDRYR